MLVTKLVMATSAIIIHPLALGTSCPRPTAPMRFDVWSSENGAHPGAAVSGNDSLPAVTAAPPAGFSPPDTLGVQSVAVCMELFGCDVGAPIEDGAAEGPEGLALVDLLPPLRPITRI